MNELNETTRNKTTETNNKLTMKWKQTAILACSIGLKIGLAYHHQGFKVFIAQ